MNNEKLTDVAYARILESIASGELAPGAIVSHRKLAALLELGKQPVGSALERLEYDGVVKALPRVGTVVIPVDSAEMWGWCQWRLAIECRCARLAAQHITPVQGEKLAELAGVIDKLLEEKAPQTEQLRQDIAFHRFAGVCSGCARLASELRKLNIYCFKTRMCDALKYAPETAALRVPHAAVAEAILSGDPEKAAQVMTAHLECSGEMLMLGSRLREDAPGEGAGKQ